MLVYVPVAIGIGVGIIMLFLTNLLRNISASFSNIPSLVGFITFVILIVIGFYVGGFEGVAYVILGVTIVLFSIVSFTKSIKN
ncbi:hypothetical protein [Paraliobacillus sp. JSM ZJ581]|uniref:hypothetical protein n=1 Tax=Paraliobacillus sp. JSM ZJ581 TaxID=3342118 RepID=UPI0035A82814